MNVAHSTVIEKIEIDGNVRVNNETIKMFSGVKIGDDLTSNQLNDALKKLYETNFFEDVQLKIVNSILKISVKEIQLKPKIDTHDFKIKLNKSRKFLDSGDKVKFTMRFRGREAEHPEFGQKVLDNYIIKLLG